MCFRFRRYLNLKPYENFEAWNSDREVARAAELLYGHIENLELYPGLMAECTKPAIPGSGVCPGQTTGRGILDDAVSLVRGDRFLSYDFNSNTLTQWGAATLQESSPGSYGGMLPRLLLTGLPGAFTGTSTYALLPFYTPEAAKGILKENGVLQKYHPERPANDMDTTSIHTLAGCKQVLEDRDSFREMYRSAVRNCTKRKEFIPGLDDVKWHHEQSTTLQSVFFVEGFEKDITKFFSSNVRKLIEQNSLSFTKGKRSIDVVRNVTNITPILWLADRFAIPLKTQEQPHGLVSIYQTFNAYLSVFMYQNFNLIPAHEWKLRETAMEAAALLRPIFETHLKTQRGMKEAVVDWIAKGSAFEVRPEADRLYHALNASRLPLGDLVGDCIGMGASIAANLTGQASLLIDLFLSPGYERYKERLVELAHMDVASSEKELQGFVYEGMRHASIIPGLPRIAAKDVTIVDGACGPTHVKAGRTILVATSKAAMDPAAFPEPEKLNPHRRFDDYAPLGHGMHSCFDPRMFGSSLAATLREIFKLKNLRRSPGKLGNFTVVERDLAGIKMRRYLDSSAKEVYLPASLTVEYDV